MTQTSEAPKDLKSRALHADNNSTYMQFDQLGNEYPAIFNPENDFDSALDGEDVRVTNQALLAHETLRRLVELRNMYDTDTFPISGNGETAAENPTDEELRAAAAEVAALTLGKNATAAFGLQSEIADNTNFYEPPTVEVASLLVNAAVETHDPRVMQLAEQTLPSFDEDFADTLAFDLHESFGIITEEERTKRDERELLEQNREAYKLLHAAERVERLEQYTKEELAELEHDDAKRYVPSFDD